MQSQSRALRPIQLYFMALHTLFSTVSYCSVLWFIICSTARTKTENIGSEQKKNEEKQPIIFYLIAYLPSHFAICIYLFISNLFFSFFYLISYLRPISPSKITNKVLSLLEACFDLISSPSLSMKIQIMGGKITEIWGSNPRCRR